jgi:peptidoglycan/xylan/chitin deacetylase (PgdA/CDA1 family)
MLKKIFTTASIIAVAAVTVATVTATNKNQLVTATAVGDNLIANASLEQASGNMPAGWSNDKWGTSTTVFTYATTGHTGSRSLSVKTSNYRSGDAKWYFSPVNVAESTSYIYSDWYKSTVSTDIDVVVTNTAGKVSYLWQGTLPASASWKQATYQFKTPAKAKNVTVYHYVHGNGQLDTDDYSLTQVASAGTPTTPPATPAAPTVQLSAPANNATVSGTVNIAANATDSKGISKVQFKLDGADLGAADTTSPYSYSWNTAGAANGSHVLSAVATNSDNLTATSANVTVNVNNANAPVVSVTAPTEGATITGTQAVNATASSNVAINSVQFRLDGTNLGAADTTAPYGVNWNSTSATNGAHKLTAVATNSSSQSTTSSEVNVTVNNPSAPIVSITAPAASATVSGTQAVTANATSNVAITSVQFKLDGANLGAADTTAPYSVDWNTATGTNGNHVLTAVATNSVNQSTTAANVTVNVSNTVVITPPANNLIANASVEDGTSSPTSWQGGAWGTNTATLSYQTTGGHTGTDALKTTITSYTDGAANWYFNPVAVQGGQTYQYSNWYQSTVDTEVDIEITLADNSVVYQSLVVAPASSTWTEVKGTFVAPTNAVSATVYQVLDKVGSVTTDDFSLTAHTPAKFTNAIVSLTFDDGWKDQYDSGRPLLNTYGLPATYYLLTSTVSDPQYMTTAMMQTLGTEGNELASHTITHPHLPTLTVAAMDTELADSQTQLRTWFGATAAKNFASPYGEYNPTVIAEIKKLYRSHRSTDVGYNSKDNFDIYNIKVQNVLDTTTAAQVQAWVDQAIADKTWLVLVYHRVGVDNATEEDYGVSVANLNTELNYIKNSGVNVKTVDAALDEISTQL